MAIAVHSKLMTQKEQAEADLVDIPALRSTVAQYIHYGLLWKPSLSAFSAIFKFMQTEWGEPRPWWPSARREFVLVRTPYFPFTL